MSDSPDALGLVVRSVDQLRTDMGQRFDAQDREIAAIRKQTTETNGRVREVERWRIAKEAAELAVIEERQRVETTQSKEAETTARARDVIGVVAMVAAVPATILAALIASGKLF